jgi:hypothetical protein
MVEKKKKRRRKFRLGGGKMTLMYSARHVLLFR